MKELDQGFRKAVKEKELKAQDCPEPLTKFVADNENKMKQLTEQSQLAMVYFLTFTFILFISENL